MKKLLLFVLVATVCSCAAGTHVTKKGCMTKTRTVGKRVSYNPF